MTKNLENKFANLINIRVQMENAMYEYIQQALAENDNELTYIDFVTSDDWCGYEELRFIKYDQDGNLTIFDEDDFELYRLMDLSADEIYDICMKIKVD